MTPPLNVLSLFAGIGGLELGLERAGMSVVGQVELDPFCRRVLAKHWPDVPRHDDVRTAADWWLSEERPTVDLICGGFPCQDISHAGRQAGITGARSGLWAFMRDTVRAVRPRYVLMENVPAIVVRGLDVVAADLVEIGYDLRWDCVPADAVGAPHLRDRWFAVAYTHSDGVRQQPVAVGRGVGASVTVDDGSAGTLADPDPIGCERRPRDGGQAGRPQPSDRGAEMADTDGQGQLQPGRGVGEIRGRPGHGSEPVADANRARRQPGSWMGRAWPAPVRESWWAVEPDVGRVAHGIPGRVDRVGALGNAVVPQVAEHVGRLIVAADQERAA